MLQLPRRVRVQPAQGEQEEEEGRPADQADLKLEEDAASQQRKEGAEELWDGLVQEEHFLRASRTEIEGHCLKCGGAQSEGDGAGFESRQAIRGKILLRLWAHLWVCQWQWGGGSGGPEAQEVN